MALHGWLHSRRAACPQPTTRIYALHSTVTRSSRLRCSGTRYGDHVSAVPPFDPSAGEPGYLYMAVAEHIAARIAAGELKPGARLPAERDLAAEYGVSLATGRRAVRVLRERGMLVTLPVKGTFVVSRTDR